MMLSSMKKSITHQAKILCKIKVLNLSAYINCSRIDEKQQCKCSLRMNSILFYKLSIDLSFSSRELVATCFHTQYRVEVKVYFKQSDRSLRCTLWLPCNIKTADSFLLWMDRPLNFNAAFVFFSQAVFSNSLTSD